MKNLIGKSIIIFLLLFNSANLFAQEPWWWPFVYQCDQVDPCNMLNNGSPLDDPDIYLGSINTPSPIDGSYHQQLTNHNVVHCWFPLSGLPNVPVNPVTWGIAPCTSSVSVPPSCMLDEFVLGCATNGHVATMGQRANFIANHKYFMYFKIRTSATIDNFYINLGDHTSVVWPSTPSYGGYIEGGGSVSINENIYTLTNITDPVWTYYCFSFTPTANYDMIYLYPQMTATGGPVVANNLHITDIHLNDLTLAAFPNNNYILDCLNTTVQLGNLNCTLPGGGTWSWTSTPAATMTGTNTGTPTFGPINNTSGAPITYTVIATYTLPGSLGGCSTSVTNNIIVNPNTTNYPITGLSTYWCTGQQLTFSTGFGSCPTCSITWFVSPGNATINGPNDLSTVTVDGGTGTFVLNVQIVDVNGCQYDGSIIVNQQAPLVNISGPTPVCPNATWPYTATVVPPGSYNYIWSLSGGSGATFVSGQVTPTATIQWSNNPGTYSMLVQVISNSVPACTTSAIYFVTVSTPPAIPIITTPGPANTCISPVNFTISNFSMANNYVWSVTNGTINSGQGTGTANISFIDPTLSAIISVEVTDANGCKSTGTFSMGNCCTGPPGPNVYNIFAGTNTASQVFGVGTPSIIGATINVNADLIMDQTMFFTGCNFNMNTNTKIVVNPNIDFQLRVCTLKACVDYWDGVYIQQASSSIQAGDCEFRDAKNAVYSTNGGVFFIVGSTFLNNNIGVKVENWVLSSFTTVNHKVGNCTFTGGALSWLGGANSFCGVQLIRVHGVIIGEYSPGIVYPANDNVFTKLNYGIHSTSSYFSAIDNAFSGLEVKPGDIFSSTGIYIESFRIPDIITPVGVPDQNTNYIGFNRLTGQYVKNEFSNSDFGIFTLLSKRNNIERNRFINLKKVGIACAWNKHTFPTIIDKNDLNNSGFTTYTALLPIGISMVDISPSNSARYRVTNNTLNGFLQGVRDLSSFRPNISNNNITLPVSGTIPGVIGIHGINISNSIVNNNIITKPLPLSLNAIGIFNESTPIATDKCNSINNCWLGMVNGGPSPTTKYTCNTMTRSYAGYYNYSGYMGNQFIGANKSQENRFVTTPIYLLTNNPIILDTWYKRLVGLTIPLNINFPGAIGDNNENGSLNPLLETNVVQQSTFAAPACGCNPGPLMVELPQIPNHTPAQLDSLKHIFNVNMVNETGIKPPRYLYMEKDVLYKMILADSAMSTAPDMISFLGVEANTSIGISNRNGIHTAKHSDLVFAEVANIPLLDNELSVIEARKTENNSIVPYLDIEQVCKYLHGILFNAQSRSVNNKKQNIVTSNSPQNPFLVLYPFNKAELDSLLDIAQLCAYEIGSCVYEARSVLEVLGISYQNNSCEFNLNDIPKSAVTNNEIATDEHWVKLYPNPASTEVYIEVDYDMMLLQPTVTLMDITGKVIYTMIMNEIPYRLNTENLGSGIYFIQVTTETGEKVVKQLIVSH